MAKSDEKKQIAAVVSTGLEKKINGYAPDEVGLMDLVVIDEFITQCMETEFQWIPPKYLH